MPDNASSQSTDQLAPDSSLHLSPSLWHGRGWSSDWARVAMQIAPARSHLVMNEALLPGKDGSS